MAGIGKAKQRCSECDSSLTLCMCAVLPRLDLRTKVTLVIHRHELLRSSNTGMLALRALVNSELRIRGRPHELTKTDDLMHPDRDTLLLYPSEDAKLLTPDFVKTLRRPLTLIAPDGSWRQASKVSFREPGLKHALRVKLPEGPPSEYKLRREPKPEGLATIEAIARAMGALESPHVQAELERVFRTMVERVLASRAGL